MSVEGVQFIRLPSCRGSTTCERVCVLYVDELVVQGSKSWLLSLSLSSRMESGRLRFPFLGCGCSTTTHTYIQEDEVLEEWKSLLALLALPHVDGVFSVCMGEGVLT